MFESLGEILLLELKSRAPYDLKRQESERVLLGWGQDVQPCMDSESG